MNDVTLYTPSRAVRAQLSARLSQCRFLLSFAGMLSAVLTVQIAIGQQTPAESNQPTQQPQPQSPPTARSHPKNPELWDVEQMMEDAVQQIATRYKLNDAQKHYTSLLLKQRTRAFLKDHEKDIRQLLKEQIGFQISPRGTTDEEYISWAERAIPIYEAAFGAIYAGNDEWRKTLDEEQLKVHDNDLELMRQNQKNIRNLLEDWKKGQKLPGRASAQTEEGGASENPPPTRGPRLMEDQWMSYVRQFIDVYKLDEKQANSALNNVHKEAAAEARAYRGRVAKDLEKVDKSIQEIRNDSTKQKEKNQALDRKRELEKPIREIFVKLHTRLMELTTSTQRKDVDPRRKKRLDVYFNAYSGKSEERDRQPIAGLESTTQPGGASESQPAGQSETQPAQTIDPAASSAESQPA